MLLEEKWMLEFIKTNINMIINVSGVALFAALWFIATRLSSNKRDVKNAKKGVKRDSVYNTETESMEGKEEYHKPELEVMREKSGAFYKTCAWYETFAQLVAIFPLMGILGTVAALMLLTNNNAEIEELYANLGVALGSTLWGMLWSIVLKLFTALYPSRVINEVENELEDFTKMYANAELKKNLES